MFCFPALTAILRGKVPFQLNYKADIMIKESSTGLKPAQVYSHFSVQLRYGYIFIPMDLNMLTPAPPLRFGKRTGQKINLLFHVPPTTACLGSLCRYEYEQHLQPDSHLPSHSARLLIIHLNKFAKATRVVVMCCFCISKSL